MKNGSIANFSLLKLPVHPGTHVDALGHVFDHYFDAGFDVDTLVLFILNGWLMYQGIDKNITADVMKSLNIPMGVRCVLFRTLNTTGMDYLSVVAYDDLISSHLGFLQDAQVILVEGLKLDDVPAGVYDVHCLPLRLLGGEGLPTRCILIK